MKKPPNALLDGSKPETNFRIKIGVKPPQSDFNRRASEYAKRADWVFKKKKPLKVSGGEQ